MKTFKDNWPRLAIFAAGLIALFGILNSIPDKAHAQSFMPTFSANSTQVTNGFVQPGLRALINLNMYNPSSGTVYMLVFDTNAIPANGTAPTLAPVQVQKNSTASMTYNAGRQFTNGICVMCSSSDTTLTNSTNGWFDMVFK